MRSVGFGLIAMGVVGLLIAWEFGTGIMLLSQSGLASTVEHIDFIFQRQYQLIFASLAIIVGVVTVISSLHNRLPITRATEQHEWMMLFPRRERDLADETYRSWLIKKYDIERNKLFKSFYFQQQTFSSLERALSAAHALDIVEEDALEWAERRNYEKARVDAAEVALAKQASFDKKIIVIVGVSGLAIIFATLFQMA